MGLFDDLLKKPTVNTGSTSGTGDDSSSGSTGTNSPASDPLAVAVAAHIPVIQKSEEISIVTESAANMVPSTPPPVTVMAETDTSSIIISPASSIINTDYTLSEEVENISKTPTVTDSVAVETSKEVDLGNLFGEDKIGDNVTENFSSMENSSEISLIDSASEISESISSEDTFSHQSSSESDTYIVADPGAMTDANKSMQSEVTETGESVLNFSSHIQEESDVTEELYEHPSEFIEASIARIDAMIARIDELHNSKLSEALGYKAEKEKYTLLEEQAYADAEKYVGEKEHALAMRAYFVDQGRVGELKTSEPVASVETILTGLAVQNAVSETVKHEKKSKTKKEEKEETQGILGL